MDVDVDEVVKFEMRLRPGKCENSQAHGWCSSGSQSAGYQYTCCRCHAERSAYQIRCICMSHGFHHGVPQ